MPDFKPRLILSDTLQPVPFLVRDTGMDVEAARPHTEIVPCTWQTYILAAFGVDVEPYREEFNAHFFEGEVEEGVYFTELDDDIDVFLTSIAYAHFGKFLYANDDGGPIEIGSEDPMALLSVAERSGIAADIHRETVMSFHEQGFPESSLKPDPVAVMAVVEYCLQDPEFRKAIAAELDYFAPSIHAMKSPAA